MDYYCGDYMKYYYIALIEIGDHILSKPDSALAVENALTMTIAENATVWPVDIRSLDATLESIRHTIRSLNLSSDLAGLGDYEPKS